MDQHRTGRYENLEARLGFSLSILVLSQGVCWFGARHDIPWIGLLGVAVIGTQLLVPVRGGRSPELGTTKPAGVWLYSRT